MKKTTSYEIKGILELAVLFAVGIAGYYGYILLNRVTGGSYGTIPCILVMGFLAGLTGGLLLRRNWSEEVGVCLIFAGSMALRLDYIYYTSCYMRQHDTLLFDYPMGHLGYIGYLYYEGHLPDFDPRSAWSFSHPPLHHFISAVWVRVQTVLGLSLDAAVENIQLLTLFYSLGILLFSYLILKEFSIKGKTLYAILLVLAFHPTFVMLAGSVNNDALSLFFLMGAILYTIRWYKESSMKHTLILAVMIGCAMMTKVSAGLVAPAVAVVFLIRLIKERTKWKKYFVKFTAFGAVVFPLGLWAPLRNKILFGVPLNYAEKLKIEDLQYIGDIPMIQRFTDFSWYQFEHLNIQFADTGAYREFQVIISLLKTAIFSEFDFYLEHPLMECAGTGLFWLNVLLVIACIAAGIYSVIWKRKHFAIEKVFFLLMMAVFMVSYFSFCAGYPHICTMNIRYVFPVIFGGLFLLAIALQERKKDFLEYLLLAAAGIWSALSIVMFVVLGTV